MVIYIEAILAINSMIHYNFSILTMRLIKQKKSLLRLLIGLLIDNGYMLLYMNNRLFVFFRYPLLIILSFITFQGKWVLGGLVYFLLNLLLGGTVGLFGIYTNYHYLIITICLFLIILISEYFKNYLHKKKITECFYYDLEICGKKIKGYLDTGNTLVIDEKPVLFLKKKINAKYIKEVSFETVMGRGMTSLYLADVFIMVDGVMKKLDCYIAYSKIEYDCLLNVEILNQI